MVVRFILAIVGIIGFLATFGVGTAKAEMQQKVLGAGPSAKVAASFFEAFEKRPEAKGYTFEVDQRSTKHAGGIRASGTYLFGRTGRPLSDSEKAPGKFDIFLAGTPVGFVVGKGAGVTELSFDQARDIFLRKIRNWKEVGGPDAQIVLLGREKTEAALSVLRFDYPFLDEAKYDKVFKRDHAVVNFLMAEVGHYAIGFGAFPNFEDWQIINVPGHSPVVNLGLVVDQANEAHEIVKAVQAFAKSDEWASIARSTGVSLPAER